MKELIKRAYEHGKEFADEGAVADYIPELAKADKNKVGVVLIDKDGTPYEMGEVEEKFSIQSISKVITYLMVLENIEKEKIEKTFDVKPTALPFNSVLDLELGGGKPRNPLVNAGAIAATSLLYEKFGEETFDKILDRIRALAGNPEIDYSEDIYVSERDSAFNNRAIINLMTARGVVSDKLPLDDVANTYFKVCSILVNARDLARISMVISNDGMDLIEDKRIFEEKYGRPLRTVMATCGMYNFSGEFAMNVGMPGKSGVGGGIIVSSRAGYGLATYCPGLDEFGNSLVGTKIIEKISNELDLAIY